MVTIFALPLMLSLARPAPAAEQAACDGDMYRQFDFWVGTWDVTAPDGRKAGRNRITREQNGCLLVEHWQGVKDSTGTSMNFYDPVTGAWRQVWVSPGVEVDISGGMVDGSMVLQGTIVYLEDARSRLFRGTWTPMSEGRVRQFFEEADEAGDWHPWFEGIYRPVEGSES